MKVKHLYEQYLAKRSCNISYNTFYNKYKKFWDKVFETRRDKPWRPYPILYPEYKEEQRPKPSRPTYKSRRDKGMTHEEAMYMRTHTRIKKQLYLYQTK